ncbi:hypothetical protein P3W45_001406 [Vairimorpha bombi]|jgi:hypothetical protein
MSTHSHDTSPLEEIQHELDNQAKIYAKKEFNVNLEYYNSIKPLLQKRDEFLLKSREMGKLEDFWVQTFLNCDIGLEMLPSDTNNQYDASWIKSIKVEYADNFICSVRIELLPNEYIENNALEKRMCLSDQEVEYTKVLWKGNNKCPIFSFFDNESEEYEIFDYLYEIYINAYFYYSLQNEE